MTLGAVLRGFFVGLGLLRLPACDDDGGAALGRDASIAPPGASDASVLPGCAEYCTALEAACGAAGSFCVELCSTNNRQDKVICSAEHEALRLCYAAHTSSLCDGGVPDECIDELGKASSCFRSAGENRTGCVDAPGSGCNGDFVDGRTVQRTCYPGVAVPDGCTTVGEILALRGFEGYGPPELQADGTLVDSTLVCCPP